MLYKSEITSVSSLGKILTNLSVTQTESGDIALKMDMCCCLLFAAWGREEEVTNTRSCVKFWSCGKPLRLLNSQKGKTLSISQQWIHQRCPALLIFHCAALGQCKNIRVEIYCAILWQTEIPGSSALASSDLLSVGLMCVSTFWTTGVYDICGWIAQSWDVSCTPNSFVWFFSTSLAFVVFIAQSWNRKECRNLEVLQVCGLYVVTLLNLHLYLSVM